MTDEEFERLKEAEKEHLREKKQLQRTLQALKKRNRLQNIVDQMKRGAGRLLEETESLVHTLRQSVAHREARLESALEDPDADGLHEAEAELREERADELVHRYKAVQSSAIRSHRSDGGAEVSEKESQKGPEKTIGRMNVPSSKEASDDS